MTKETTKFTGQTLKKVEVVLTSLKTGSSVEKSCKSADLNRSTFYQWKRYSDENSERFYEIIDSRTLTVEDSLFKNAVTGSVAAQIFWLKCRSPKRWSENVNINLKNNNESNLEQIKEIAKKEGLSLEELCENEGISL